MPSPATAKRLFEEGKVREAQGELSAYLRERPADTAQRTFLFELLCFSGDFDRAEKQLGVLAQGDSQTELGAVLYYSALHAERLGTAFSIGRNSRLPSLLPAQKENSTERHSRV